MKKMAAPAAPAGTVSMSTADVSQLPQHLAEVQSVRREAIPSLCNIIDACDAIPTRVSIMGPVVHMPPPGKNAIVASHDSDVAAGFKEVRPYCEAALNLLQQRFGFESVATPPGDVPPIPGEDEAEDGAC